MGAVEAAAKSAGSMLRYGVAILCIVLTWGGFALVQRYHWGAESYYNFGWYVLPAWVLLLYFRWADMPALSAPSRARQIGALLLLGIGLATVVPLRLFNEVNTFWRVPFLAQGVVLLGVSYVTLYLMAGRRVTLHHGWALLFLLAMVPWPYRVEVTVIQTLTQWITEVTVAILRILGYPSEVRGNTIMIGGTWLGVDEACSGIRSLQALTVIGYWLSEYLRLRPMWRVALVAIAALLTVIFNTLRAVLLALVTFHGGEAAHERWHDPLGYLVFIAGVFSLYFIGEWLAQRRAQSQVPEDARQAPEGEPSGKAFGRLQAIGAALVLGMALLTPVAVHQWFARADSERQRSNWDFVPGGKAATQFEAIAIPERVEGLLGYDFGHRWLASIGLRKVVQVYYYGYTGEDRMASVSSYGHSPLICIDAMGSTVTAQYNPLPIVMGDGLVLRLEHLRYAQRGAERGSAPEVFDLFWCVWEWNNQGVDSEQLQQLDYRTQLELLKVGRRDYARQVLLMTLSNMVSPSHARAYVRDLVQDSVRVGAVPQAQASGS